MHGACWLDLCCIQSAYVIQYAYFQVLVGRGYARAYNQRSLVMRSHEDHLRDARSALESGKVSLVFYSEFSFYVCFLLQVIFGVKGYSPLHLLPSFDVIKGVPVDYMHCVLIGVVKNMAKLWFNSTNHRKEWYMILCTYTMHAFLST